MNGFFSLPHTEFLMNRMTLLGLLFALVPTLAAAAKPSAPKPHEMTVYRSPTCSCCGKWLDQMKQKGFNIKDIKTDDMAAIKRQQGVPDNLQSCHTAVVDGHVVEGHVPAEDIQRMLKENKPGGISVPGMPVGTPGMEMGARKDPYAVVGFDKNGNTQVFQDHSGQ